MKSGKKTGRASKAPALDVLAPVGGNVELEAARILESAKASPRCHWILVDEGQGLAQELIKLPALAALDLECASGPKGCGDWSLFMAASAKLQAQACLLLPQGVTLGQALLLQLNDALKSAEIVFSRRPSPASWPLRVQRLLWSLPGLDFGSPLMARTDRWRALTQGKDPQALFLGPSLAREAMRANVPVKQCEALDLAPPRSGSSVLGEEARAAAIVPSLRRILLGAFLFVIGLSVVMPRSNFLGLTLLGIGFFVVCTVVGEE